MTRSRGQTTLDFAIGVSVFLLAVAFVFSFVPGMVQPFADSGQEQMSASNRLADRLATDVLTDDEAYVLDSTCTDVFFDETTAPTAADGCDFDGVDATAALSLGVRTDLNAVLLADLDGDGTGETLCRATDGSLVADDDADCPNDAATFVAGDSVPEQGSVVTATRRVTLDGVHAKLVVKVW
ncbi:DUF7287 family protein [Halomarina oriensis]|uniref:Uncharacterized protein n=1 Tax=Halomarina oriensis TaxID=671145 RepID=A0A6B0GFS3_9EURY|nr:hypothetical protein [Halomarina oriensis]MWG33360.1 hypothetical protein [Halomarina oriensis]